jgi:hypothetical protein
MYKFGMPEIPEIRKVPVVFVPFQFRKLELAPILQSAAK